MIGQQKLIGQWKLIVEESLFKRKVDWQGKFIYKLIDKESWLMGKVYWCEKSIDEESWFTRKVNWQGKLSEEESWLMRKVNRQKFGGGES